MKKTVIILSITIIFAIILIVTYICSIINVWKVENEEHYSEGYIRMTELNDNKSLIGLSEKEVIELLGEPRYKDIDNRPQFKCTYYTYGAGVTFKKTILGNTYDRKYYQFEIIFDENDIVKSTYIKEST